MNMKKFQIAYTNVVYVSVIAETEEEALEKFTEAPVESIEAYQDPVIWRVEEVDKEELN